MELELSHQALVPTPFGMALGTVWRAKWQAEAKQEAQGLAAAAAQLHALARGQSTEQEGAEHLVVLVASGGQMQLEGRRGGRGAAAHRNQVVGR